MAGLGAVSGGHVCWGKEGCRSRVLISIFYVFHVETFCLLEV